MKVRILLDNFSDSHNAILQALAEYNDLLTQADESDHDIVAVQHILNSHEYIKSARRAAKTHLRRTENLIWELGTLV